MASIGESQVVKKSSLMLVDHGVKVIEDGYHVMVL